MLRGGMEDTLSESMEIRPHWDGTSSLLRHLVLDAAHQLDQEKYPDWPGVDPKQRMVEW